MPITLPPLSRRSFLKSAVAAGAATALAGCQSSTSRSAAATAMSGRDPHRVALFSDIHVSSDPAKVGLGVNMTDHLRQASTEVLSLGTPNSGAGPSMVLINGDVAYNQGLPADYAHVADLLHPLRAAGLPAHLGLGNHDDRAALQAALGDHDTTLADRQVLLIPTPRADWIMLDSLLATRTTPGYLGPDQLRWLQQTLDAPARRNKPVIVLTHHQPQTPPSGWGPPSAEIAARNHGTAYATTLPSAPPGSDTKKVGFTGLIDTAPLMDVLLPRKQVKALLFGHTHVWSHEVHGGLHLVNLPAVAYPFRPEQPSAWVDCQLRPDGASMLLNCLTKPHPKDRELLDLKWRT